MIPVTVIAVLAIALWIGVLRIKDKSKLPSIIQILIKGVNTLIPLTVLIFGLIYVAVKCKKDGIADDAKAKKIADYKRNGQDEEGNYLVNPHPINSAESFVWEIDSTNFATMKANEEASENAANKVDSISKAKGNP